VTRRLVSSGSPYEPAIGLSRAVRIGPWISVAGTAPLLDGATVHAGDLYAQTKQCLAIMLAAIAEARRHHRLDRAHARHAHRHRDLARRRPRPR